MTERQMAMPDIILFAGTRVALGAGIGLLLAGRLRREARRGAGWALLAVGALTTIPFVVKARNARRSGDLEPRGARPPWMQPERPEDTIHSP